MTRCEDITLVRGNTVFEVIDSFDMRCTVVHEVSFLNAVVNLVGDNKTDNIASRSVKSQFPPLNNILLKLYILLVKQQNII